MWAFEAEATRDQTIHMLSGIFDAGYSTRDMNELTCQITLVLYFHYFSKGLPLSEVKKLYWINEKSLKQCVVRRMIMIRVPP